jgi:serine/threonine-protein kinase
VSAKLRGEHVTRLMDFGAPEGGPPFMVMEYLQGVDVRQAIKQNGPLPVEVAIDYIVQACEGLAEAHALGVVHRDLKPSNLFLSKRLDGTDLVKILDFGVSKMAGLKDVDDELTTAGSVLGSPRYMSPEQLRNSGDVDARADVWSLGAIFYEMLTGRAPFQAPSTAALCAKILGTDPIPSITAERPDVSAAIEHAAFKCLARERDQRTPDVSGFIADLALATNLPWVSAAVGRISAVLERRSTRGEGFSGSYPGLNSSSQQRALGPLSSPSAMAMADASSRSSKAAAPPPAKRPIVPIAIAAVLLLLGGGLLLTRKTPPVPAPAAPPPVASPATTPAPSAAPPPPATTEAKPTAPPSATATAGNDRSAPPGDPPRGKGGNGKKGAATPPPPGPTPPTPPPATPPPRTNPLDDRF